MFQWLERELSEIRWKRFHVVDGPASESFRSTIGKSPIPVPPSYKDFALRFGNARLFRELGRDYWIIDIFAAPREVTLKKTHENLLWVGRYGEVFVYFRADDLASGQECPVYEGGRNGFRRAGDTFESWLRLRADRARNRFQKREWGNILSGPAPFSEEESRIVEARNLFRWRILGFNESGDARFEVTNASQIRLPFLSIGLRSKDHTLNGRVWLQVASIAPGETAVVEHDAYKNLVSGSEWEAFSLRDPDPEDREQYWEFRQLIR